MDWGNEEWFEPGSGDIAAPEGFRLDNRAHADFRGTSCALKSVVTPPTTTSVRRFLFWKIGDNDLLYAPTFGQTPDEITYEIFLKNMSGQKTWWNVSIWDSVPAEIDPWCVNCGFNDPCLGWTMTPSGCAAAAPGKQVSAGRTMLTWKMDLAPGQTLTLRWKGQVAGAGVSAGDTAINTASIFASGRTAVVGGTGSSVVARNFTHVAPIVLPTTYISYVGMAAAATSKCKGCEFFISFFPLNKKSQFELRGIEYEGAGYPTLGGKSESIGCIIGDCLSGFPGNGACVLGQGFIDGGGVPGCKVERTPARYHPQSWIDGCPPMPFNFLYKLTSNAPVLWQLLTFNCADNNDNHTFAPASSLSYAGMIHYMWRRQSTTQAAGYGDSLSLINTGMDAYGNYDAALGTTVHLFEWDYGSLTWNYRRTYEIDRESQAFDMTTLIPDDNPWRAISSDAQLIVNQSSNIINTLGCCCGGCSDNFGAFFPCRETGNVVSQVGAGTFFGLVQGFNTNLPKLVIGNTGAAAADYRIWRYSPANLIAIAPMPALLNGTSGTWLPATLGTVPSGIGAAGNPQVYGPAVNAGSTALYKVELLSGGPIQVNGGNNQFSRYSGGAVMHAADGEQTGIQFWFNQSGGGGCSNNPGETGTQTVNVFCPKLGMTVRAVTNDGYSATYTTDGPDQVISFTTFTNLGGYNTRNWRFDVLPNPSQGNVITQYIQCNSTEKGYTAPFLQTGTHYVIITPPVVYSGESFWITVVVLEQGGITKNDYCATNNFTSTDPNAKIEGFDMGTYTFEWTSTSACSDLDDENGVKMFVNVTFNKLGPQTIVATDLVDGSITGVAALIVVGADIKLSKEPRLSVAASGDVVRFKVCWSNYSSASGFMFTMTDAVPEGTTLLPEPASQMSCGNTDGVTPQVAFSGDTTSPTPPATWTDISGAAAPAAGTRWLRWTFPSVGVGTTGCACYSVTVN